MKKILKHSLLLASVISIASCTPTGASYKPVIDTNNPNYGQDILDCQKLAKEFLDLGYDTAIKTGVSGAIGAGVGQMIGGNTKGTLIGTGVGLVAAGIGKTLEHNDDRKDIIIKCMSGRGYNVLK